MATTLTIQDIPDDLYSWLQQQAAGHSRSLSKEVIAVLESCRPAPARPRRKPTVEEIMAIAHRCSALPVLDGRSADEIVGYDENGIPC